ncbi:unnamed protein product [Tetraodon nigroviridis]|uniref:(spotted green pufferfish) hypothetical protein n=1 Tax=Tetraodon nigroviridis TaxID=99883 RepID=Q4RGB5_TETNG|nr:unnamed protein product [Tetraodon nigroviridis]
MEAEREKLTLKYYISEEHVGRIHKDVEASERLTDRARRELLETDAGVPCGCELDGRWDELKKAMETKEEEVAYLQHLLREQKEEMEAKGAALEERTQKATAGGGALGERGAPGGGGVRHGGAPEQGTL